MQCALAGSPHGIERHNTPAFPSKLPSFLPSGFYLRPVRRTTRARAIRPFALFHPTGRTRAAYGRRSATQRIPIIEFPASTRFHWFDEDIPLIEIQSSALLVTVLSEVGGKIAQIRDLESGARLADWAAPPLSHDSHGWGLAAA